MKNQTKLINCFGFAVLLSASQINAMQSIEEDNLRDVSGQSGLDLDLNFKGTIGRTYLETDGNSVNIRNLSFDTDSANDDGLSAGSDRPLKMELDLVTRGKKTGVSLAITEINSLDLVIEQININGDDTAGAVLNQNSSFGGLALTNISDNGGTTEINMFARGASGEEGIQMEMILPELLTMDLAYTDYGDDNSVSTDDYSFGGKLTLNNFTVSNSVDLTSGQNSAGEEVGGLHIGIIHQSGDITLSNIRAGNQLGTMGRLVVNGYRMTPESYFTIQGK